MEQSASLQTAVGSADVDAKAQEEIAGMGNVRRKIVDALTEERVRLDVFGK